MSDKAELDISHYSSRPIADDSMAQQDILRCAHFRRPPLGRNDVLQADPRRMPGVIAVFESYPQKIFVRIALHVLAKKPDAAPELAEEIPAGPGINRQPLVRGGNTRNWR